jgi:predicted outer membrane repeat protein
MQRKLLRRMVAPLCAVAAAGLWPAQVAQAASASAVVDVPCSATSLASDMSSATSGETLSLMARCIYRLTAGLPVISQDLTIVGNGATLRRSDAPATPAFTILSVADSSTVAVSDLNFVNGDGAISVTGGSTSLTVQGGRFAGNKAANGGAIYNNTGMGNLSVTGATFTQNTATGAGGAIYTGPIGGNLSVTGDTFTGNTAGGDGGAIFDFNIYGGYVTGCNFYRNKAADGGAVLESTIGGGVLQGVFEGNTATYNGGAIDNVYAYLNAGGTISGNHAGNDGGGIYLGFLQYETVGMMLTASVRGNSAENGGGIYIQDSIADLTNSTIDNNDATVDGGGIYNDQPGDGYGTVDLGTSKVTRNKAGADGGAIYTLGSLATVTASETPIVHNTAAAGGGIYDSAGGTVTLTNSPVLYNKPDNCEPPGSITGCPSSAQHTAAERFDSVHAVKNMPATHGRASIISGPRAWHPSFHRESNPGMLTKHAGRRACCGASASLPRSTVI